MQLHCTRMGCCEACLIDTPLGMRSPAVWVAHRIPACDGTPISPFVYNGCQMSRAVHLASAMQTGPMYDPKCFGAQQAASGARVSVTDQKQAAMCVRKLEELDSLVKMLDSQLQQVT